MRNGLYNKSPNKSSEKMIIYLVITNSIPLDDYE